MPAAPLAILFITGLALVLLTALYALKYLGKGWSFELLFKDFRRKMWMTAGLGGLFFSLYLFLVPLAAYLIRRSDADLFLFLYEHPIECLYGGLWIFACLSLAIYLVRMLIKYVYLTKGKDS